MVEFLLIDLDDTILDFHKAEEIALGTTLRVFGIDPTPETCELYSDINKACWKALERGEMTRAQVAVGRFAELFSRLDISVDAAECNRCYWEQLSIGHYFLPGAEGALQTLSANYKLYIASNGTKSVQQPRLESAGIEKYFQDIFISEDMGADKPSKIFFERCFARISDFDPKKAMIVGDSLSSDIQGGINAGIVTCWINPEMKTSEIIRPDYEIEALSQLPALLQSLLPGESVKNL